MYVVGHRVGLDDLHPLVHAAPADVLADVGAQLGVYRLTTILRGEHDVVLAVPLRVREARDLIVLAWHNSKDLRASRTIGRCHCMPPEVFTHQRLRLFKSRPHSRRFKVVPSGPHNQKRDYLAPC